MTQDFNWESCKNTWKAHDARLQPNSYDASKYKTNKCLFTRFQETISIQNASGFQKIAELELDLQNWSQIPVRFGKPNSDRNTTRVDKPSRPARDSLNAIRPEQL